MKTTDENRKILKWKPQFLTTHAIRFQESWNLPAYFTKVFFPRRLHSDQKDPGNEVGITIDTGKKSFIIHDITIIINY